MTDLAIVAILIDQEKKEKVKKIGNLHEIFKKKKSLKVNFPFITDRWKITRGRFI